MPQSNSSQILDILVQYEMVNTLIPFHLVYPRSTNANTKRGEVVMKEERLLKTRWYLKKQGETPTASFCPVSVTSMTGTS